VIGQWTHLAAVYDSGLGQMSLYVNGILEGTAAHVSTWNASGAVRIGMGQYTATTANPWQGDVDDVRVYARALNAAEVGTIVNAPSLAGHWTLNGGGASNPVCGGVTVADSSGNGHSGTTTFGTTCGNAGLVAGGDGDAAMGFTGGYAEVPFTAANNPTTTFSVEAWATVTGGAGTWRTVVMSRQGSFSGTGARGYLIYAGADNHWQFWIGTGVPNVNWTELGGPAIVNNQPAHLVGTYDGTTVSFYVNGVLATTASSAFVPTMTKPLRIGGGNTDGPMEFPFAGSIDEVAVYPTALAATRVQAHYTAGTGYRAAVLADTPASYYRLDDRLPDTVAVDNAGTLMPSNATNAGTTSWVGVDPGDANPNGALPDGAQALHLDGSTGMAVTATGAPATIDTQRSFTVVAWVRPVAVNSNFQTAVGLDGNAYRAFGLEYAGNVNRWTFTMTDNDSTTNYQATWCTANSITPSVGQWTQLVGVYDAVAGQMRLYVNGTLAATTAHHMTWTASGPIRIGAARVNGGLFNYWNGDLADVQIYTGVLSDTQIANLGG
jgi:hypothetical protein